MRAVSKRRVLGCLALCAGAAPVLAEVTTVFYRESAESFTWELRWDGAPPTRPEEILPPRPPGEDPPLWSPVLRLSGARGAGRGTRFSFQARHTSRVHDLDAPQGPGYAAIFLQRVGSGGPREWTRLDRRQVSHLSTPKDPADTFDVYWLEETSGAKAPAGRFILQGVHGGGTKAKKPRKPKATSPPDGQRKP